jgi:uncharacterized membrane protein YjjB (DUF3815 family)
MIAAMDERKMFQAPNYGFGMGKWVYWFFAIMAIYGLTTLFPHNRVLAAVGGFFGAVGIAILRHQFSRLRKG